MTTRKVWLGSTGPFLYDDSVLYIDEDEVISPDNQQAIATDGQIVVQSAPSSPVHVIRKQDLDDAIGDIASLTDRVTALETAVTNISNSIVILNNKFLTAVFTMTYEGWSGLPGSVNVAYSITGTEVSIEIPQIDAQSNAGYVVLGNFPAALKGRLDSLGQVVTVTTDQYGGGTATAVPSQYGGWDVEYRLIEQGGGLFPVSGRKLLYAHTLKFALI